jgi:8-oxo-dGTP pyrophosphatase MutT (NUDIX family)
LLVRHTYTAGWHFPGGGVEKNETAESALARELEQETGLKLIGVPALHGVFFNRSVSVRDHVLVYLCEADGEVLANPQNLEIAEAKFFDLEQLPHDIALGTRRRLEEITKQKQPAKEW